MRKKHAPTEVLSFSNKIYLQRSIYLWNSHKIKEFNKHNNKTVTLHCYCGDNIKYGIFFKNTCVNENNNMPVTKMSK